MVSKQVINSILFALAIGFSNSLFASAGGDSKPAHNTPPQTPNTAGSTPKLRSLLTVTGGLVTTQLGLTEQTLKVLGDAVAVGKTLATGDSVTTPMVCNAINNAADAIAKPGTIGFSAHQRTTDTLKLVSANLRETGVSFQNGTANLAKITEVTPTGALRTAAAATTVYAAHSIMSSGAGVYNCCFLIGGIEYLRPGTVRACVNTTKECLRDTRAQYELSSRYPFIQSKKPVNPAMSRSSNSGGVGVSSSAVTPADAKKDS